MFKRLKLSFGKKGSILLTITKTKETVFFPPIQKSPSPHDGAPPCPTRLDNKLLKTSPFQPRPHKWREGGQGCLGGVGGDASRNAAASQWFRTPLVGPKLLDRPNSFSFSVGRRKATCCCCYSLAGFNFKGRRVSGTDRKEWCHNRFGYVRIFVMHETIGFEMPYLHLL
ncbi:hypothetical protein CEXT_531331 [Caerostris extrusa]|uniref:Uncharacterized protein n=1 Tax=Caerostris extrusa TaxID=172846 RepID=A0AAV4Y501_CAEEX|nr:hypothetical protein CEXT_531331 [Caerostris extrusa]